MHSATIKIINSFLFSMRGINIKCERMMLLLLIFQNTKLCLLYSNLCLFTMSGIASFVVLIHLC